MANIQFKPPPIFEMFTIDQLHHLLGLKKRYLCDLEEGSKPINARFISNAVLILRRSKEDLFGNAINGEHESS